MCYKEGLQVINVNVYLDKEKYLALNIEPHATGGSIGNDKVIISSQFLYKKRKK